jgi:hypothetical protein
MKFWKKLDKEEKVDYTSIASSTVAASGETTSTVPPSHTTLSFY